MNDGDLAAGGRHRSSADSVVIQVFLHSEQARKQTRYPSHVPKYSSLRMSHSRFNSSMIKCTINDTNQSFEIAMADTWYGLETKIIRTKGESDVQLELPSLARRESE